MGVKGWQATKIVNWPGLREDAKSALLRKYPKLVIIDVNIFPNSSYGNVTVRDVEMMASIANLTTANYAGVEFTYTKKEDIIIKGVAEGVIDGLNKSDLTEVRRYLEEEVGPLVRFELVKKGQKKLTIFGFGRFDLSERVVEGGVILKVVRREMRGGFFIPKIYWAKQYIAEPPTRAKSMDSPSKNKDVDVTPDTTTNSRMQALDRQRADDYLALKEDMDKGLREQAERTVDLLNYQGRETTRAFSNTIVALNKHNNEVMILIQEANRIERKLSTAQNCAKLYAVLQDENLRNLAPGFDAEAMRLEEELKKVEEELRAANDKPVSLPEYMPITKSNLLMGCDNDVTIKKKPEKPSPRKTSKRSKPDAENQSEGLLDTASLKKWSTHLTGSDPKYQAFLAKAMWRRDVVPLFTENLREDPVKAIEVVGTLAAFIKAFGDCPESKEAEKKINELITI